MLQEIKLIQCIGRFEKAQPLQTVRLGRCTLVFGENGWGKSTLADLLRSMSTNSPAILAGRATLDCTTPQKAVLRIDGSISMFEAGAWSGPRPPVAVYDSAFVNDNVYSGDVVSAEHLKNQFGLVVGEEGVARVRRIIAIDGENRDNNRAITDAENELKATIRAVGPPAMALEDFLALPPRADIDAAIAAQTIKVEQGRRAKEIKAAAEPAEFPVPTDPEKFRVLFEGSIDDVAADAVARVRAHIAAHQGRGGEGAPPHESWLEAGMAFAPEDDCPFCGQPLEDRSLIEAYKATFSQSYKELGQAVRGAMATLERYTRGEFREAADRIDRQNRAHFTYWQEAGRLTPPQIDPPEAASGRLETATRDLLALFTEKQANLTEAIEPSRTTGPLAEWTAGRNYITGANREITAFQGRIKGVKEAIDPASLPANENELKRLAAQKERHEAGTTEKAKKLGELREKKTALATEKARVRAELDTLERAITEALGKAINYYLKRLSAGFRIDYQVPTYRGSEPSASYSILIREVPVSPRSGDIDKPSFRNTLSAGDKSTLALAFFLAKVNADPKLADTIVVLDDPFTSLDHFRREFTALEIRKLCETTRQTIVLSHEKSFLRLLWDKIDQGMISAIALQSGARGITTIAPFDIVAATQPRYVTERIEIEEFAEGEQHEPSYIRTRLRTVCEEFYRKGDPALFRDIATLDEIVRVLASAPADHPYKGALDDLRAINEYSRPTAHAATPGSASEEISIEELKSFGRLVLDLTRGM